MMLLTIMLLIIMYIIPCPVLFVEDKEVTHTSNITAAVVGSVTGVVIVVMVVVIVVLVRKNRLYFICHS